MSDLGTVKISEVVSSATVVTTSSPYPMPRGPASFQATVITTSTGASAVVAAAATVQVSNDNVGWLPLGTLTVSGTGTAADGFGAVVPWQLARMIVTTLTTGISARFIGRIGA